jgi:hypothetical protein
LWRLANFSISCLDNITAERRPAPLPTSGTQPLRPIEPLCAFVRRNADFKVKPPARVEVCRLLELAIRAGYKTTFGSVQTTFCEEKRKAEHRDRHKPGPSRSQSTAYSSLPTSAATCRECQKIFAKIADLFRLVAEKLEALEKLRKEEPVKEGQGETPKISANA